MNHKLIHSEDELKYFFDNILPDLQTNEVYFLSLSARNKYLTTEERKTYGLGRTEMFERTIIREKSWSRFLRKIRRFETPEEAYIAGSDQPIPSKCIVVYFNINPSNILKAYREFSQTMNEYMFELGTASINGRSIEEVSYKLKKIDVLLMNCMQRNRGQKSYLDVDFDIPKAEYSIVQVFLDSLSSNGAEYYVIDTKSGYHVLIKRRTLKYNFNLGIEEAIEEAKRVGLNENDFEIINNKNEMIPLPGTYQAGYEVKVLRGA